MIMKMRLEDAMVYALATSGRGMTTDQLAQKINTERLHVRVDGNPVTSVHVYASVWRSLSIFFKEGGIIFIVM